MTSRAAIRAALRVALILPILAGSARAQDERGAFAPAIRRAGRAVVAVVAEMDPYPEGVQARDGAATWRNTGFFIGSGGQILTSLGGVAGCRKITVVRPDGTRTDASVLAVDQGAGLALLNSELEDTEPLELLQGRLPAGSAMLLAAAGGQGDDIGVIAQMGMISDGNGSIRLNGTEWTGLAVAHMRVRSGTAAAPVLDAEGRLAGVILAVRTPGSSLPAPGICYILPADRLATVLEPLRKGTSHRLGWLGVALAREPGGPEGVTVAGVLEGSPAHKAGIRVGDVLLQMNQRAIETPAAFATLVAGTQPGTEAQIELLRGRGLVTVRATTGTRPMLIRGGARRQSDRRLIFPLSPGTPDRDAFERLLEENRRLLRQVEELERRLQNIESAPADQ